MLTKKVRQHRRSLISQVTKQGKTIYFGFPIFIGKNVRKRSSYEKNAAL
jgi:hypothetical protein